MLPMILCVSLFSLSLSLSLSLAVYVWLCRCQYGDLAPIHYAALYGAAAVRPRHHVDCLSGVVAREPG